MTDRTARPACPCRTGTVLLLGALLAGCTVGPDFTRPQPILPSTWQEQAPGQNVPPVEAEWWTMFADPALDALETRAGARNLDVQRAVERIAAARIQRGAARAQGAPQLNAQAGYSRERMGIAGVAGVIRPLLGLEGAGPAGPGGVDFDLHSVGAGASWELDLWGKQRRLREAAQARVEAAEAEGRGARLSVQAEVARTYFQWRGLGAELDYFDQAIALAERAATVARTLQGRGLLSGAERIDADAQVRGLRLQREDLANQRKDAVRTLAVLVGGTPDAALPELQQARVAPTIGPVPARLPSEMARRRPDIAAAEAELHAATAEIGVARADFYPNIGLTGLFSLDALSLDGLGWDARNTSIGPSISLPIFSGGRLERQLELRRSEHRSAALAWRTTVVAAWREVEGALAALQMLDRRTALLRDDAAGRAVQAGSIEARYRRGDVALSPVLNAQAASLEAERALARHRTALLLARIQLVRALGG